MFTRIGSFAYHRRRRIIAVWALVFAVGMALSGVVIARLSAQPDRPTRLESAQVTDVLDRLDPAGAELVAVIDADPSTPEVRAAVEAAAHDLRQAAGVITVADPYSAPDAGLVASDGAAALILARLADDLEPSARQHAVHTAVSRLRAIEVGDVDIGGTAVIDEEYERAIERDLAVERNVLPIAFLAMVVILGGLIAAGLPMIVAFVAVAGSMFVLLAATGVGEVSIYAMNVVFMFGLGLGIDYGLLMVTRFREERAHGADIETAVRASVATAGRTVAFSAMTVAASLAGLFAFDDATFRSFGIAGIGVVITALAASVTLLPALLATFGRRIKPAPARRDGHRFARIARAVQRRAALTVVLVGGSLAAVALPFLSARFENGDARWLPRSSEVRSVAMTLTDRFPSRGADPLHVLAAADRTDPAIARYVDTLRGLPGVLTADTRTINPEGMTVIDVVPTGTSQGPDARQLVRSIRDSRPPFELQVGGTAAGLVDTKADTAARLPVAFAVIALATFVLLFLMTGSLAVPIKAIAMNVLSLGASFGALVWGFQQGHLAGLLGFEPVGSLDLTMPVLIFIFAFGLSMDYEVFLIGRIKEIYDNTGDNDRAVAEGLQRTGGIVTSAALLIVIVFAGFAMGEVLGIKMLGFGLALAVIVDTAIVRTLLVPATMKLLDHRNWWAPAPLRRFHQRYGLHEAPSAPIASDPQHFDELVHT